MTRKLQFEKITEKILGASFEVHSYLGNGFQEVIYQRALAYELTKRGLSFEREVTRQLYYKEQKVVIGSRRADFIIEDKVLVEIKAVTELTDVHMAQTLNYLKAYCFEVGLLINFGSRSLTYKRLIMNERTKLTG